jgi:apolipoprotein N-acyltransferase
LTQRFAGFPWIAGVLVLFAFCAARAIIFLIFTAVVVSIRRGRPVPMTVLAALVMPVCEFIVPQIFPCGQWISQAWNPHVIQISELTGPYGVTALLMLVNGALYDLIDRHRSARICGVATAAIVGGALIFGIVRMRQVDELMAHAPRLKIGLVQPNFAYSADGEFSREETLHQLSALQEQSSRLQHEGAQLIVWSEGSYPLALPREFAVDFPTESEARIRRGFDTPLIMGANTIDTSNDDAYNSALLLDASGHRAGIYDKVWLLAFGEYIPGIEVFPWLKNLLPAGAGGFRAGPGPGILNLHQPDGQIWRLGPVICYEDLLPEFIQRVGRVHPDVLVNLTSDSWFGARTEPWEHLALAVFSTVELRVALVRSVNSGISALIDPNGRLVAQTYANDPYRDPRGSDGIVVAAPKMPGGHTLFVAWGNWFCYASALATLIIAAIIWRDRRAKRGVGPLPSTAPR